MILGADSKGPYPRSLIWDFVRVCHEGICFLGNDGNLIHSVDFPLFLKRGWGNFSNFLFAFLHTNSLSQNKQILLFRENRFSEGVKIFFLKSCPPVPPPPTPTLKVSPISLNRNNSLQRKRTRPSGHMAFIHRHINLNAVFTLIKRRINVNTTPWRLNTILSPLGNVSMVVSTSLIPQESDQRLCVIWLNHGPSDKSKLNVIFNRNMSRLFER